jgi:hypothetical protein
VFCSHNSPPSQRGTPKPSNRRRHGSRKRESLLTNDVEEGPRGTNLRRSLQPWIQTPPSPMDPIVRAWVLGCAHQEGKTRERGPMERRRLWVQGGCGYGGRVESTTVKKKQGRGSATEHDVEEGRCGTNLGRPLHPWIQTPPSPMDPIVRVWVLAMFMNSSSRKYRCVGRWRRRRSIRPGGTTPRRTGEQSSGKNVIFSGGAGRRLHAAWDHGGKRRG